jgi:hypothetical protein
MEVNNYNSAYLFFARVLLSKNSLLKRKELLDKEWRNNN